MIMVMETMMKRLTKVKRGEEETKTQVDDKLTLALQSVWDFYLMKSSYHDDDHLHHFH